MQDFIVGNIKKEISEQKKVTIIANCVAGTKKYCIFLRVAQTLQVWLTKLLAAGYGDLAYAIVFLVKYLPGVLEAALGIFGIVGGPVLGAFTLGMFVPWANTAVSLQYYL